MSRLLSPDDACKGVDVPFGRGQRYDGNVINVSDPVHARALKAAGYTAAAISGGPARTSGYRCADCNFASFFRTCSRCGASCERPDLAA
jgi:hypothetical protein